MSFFFFSPYTSVWASQGKEREAKIIVQVYSNMRLENYKDNARENGRKGG